MHLCGVLPLSPYVGLVILVMSEPHLCRDNKQQHWPLASNWQNDLIKITYESGLPCILLPSPMSCADSLMPQWIWLWHLKLYTTPCLPAAPQEAHPPWMETRWKKRERKIKKGDMDSSINHKSYINSWSRCWLLTSTTSFIWYISCSHYLIIITIMYQYYQYNVHFFKVHLSCVVCFFSPHTLCNSCTFDLYNNFRFLYFTIWEDELQVLPTYSCFFSSCSPPSFSTCIFRLIWGFKFSWGASERMKGMCVWPAMDWWPDKGIFSDFALRVWEQTREDSCDSVKVLKQVGLIMNGLWYYLIILSYVWKRVKSHLTCSENRADTGLWSLMVKPMWLRYTCCVTLVAPPSHEVSPLCRAALWVGTGEPVRRRRHRIRSVQAGFLFLALRAEIQKVTHGRSRQIKCWGRFGMEMMDTPGVVRVCAHVKLISRWEVEWALYEALQDGLCVFSHVELCSGQTTREKQDRFRHACMNSTHADRRWCFCHSALWRHLLFTAGCPETNRCREAFQKDPMGVDVTHCSPDLAPTEEAACCCQ